MSHAEGLASPMRRCCHCGASHYPAAARLLPKVRELALVQGHALHLLRVLWLSSKIDAGEGRKEKAIPALEQVQRDFTVRGLPYDAALASLELAILWLEQGRNAEVRTLALGMAWIFKAQGIQKQALAALKLFCDAAQREEATVELTRQVIADIEKARRTGPPRPATPELPE